MLGKTKHQLCELPSNTNGRDRRSKREMQLSLSILLACTLVVVAWGEKCQFPDLGGDDQAKDAAGKNLARLDSLRGQTFAVTLKEGLLKFQLCDNPSSNHCANPGTASVIIEGGEICVNAGSYTNTDIKGENNLVTLTFSNGVPYNNALCGNKSRETIINVYCDDRPKSELTAAQSNVSQHCSYAFNLNSPFVCKHPKGLSGGSAFCIVFFTILGAYLIFGFLYRRLVVRARGVEQIPNYDCWRKLGELIADGCDFVCRCGPRQEAKMYQGIGGDPLGRSESETEERDDRLLPM